MLAESLLMLVLFSGIVVAVSEKASNTTIEELEKQKNDLFKQINIAIDESVKSLLQTNDTETNLGLEYMRHLKKHIKELNATENSKEEKGIDVDSKSDLENRRSFKESKYLPLRFTRRPKNNLFDFETILKPEGITEVEWKKVIQHRQLMQQKLDLWILERERERKKRKESRLNKKRLMISGKYEKCPRFGYYGKKETEKTKKRARDRSCKPSAGRDCRRSADSAALTDSRQQQQAPRVTRERKYPCCRKCCKQSYMGCL